jgi:alanyl-tRNA synthetase
VLGDGVEQKGSLVTDEKLRFDFSHKKALSAKELAEVEALVQAQITAAAPVDTQLVPLDAAKAINGLRAVFGEVYPDPVRVVAVGADIDAILADPSSEAWPGHSVEFCGGNHMANTAEAEAFSIVEETAVAKGIRRISAVTRATATGAIRDGDALLDACAAAEALPDDALVARVAELRERLQSQGDALPLVRKVNGALVGRAKRTVAKRSEAKNRSEAKKRVVRSGRAAYLRSHPPALFPLRRRMVAE